MHFQAEILGCGKRNQGIAAALILGEWMDVEVVPKQRRRYAVVGKIFGTGNGAGGAATVKEQPHPRHDRLERPTCCLEGSCSVQVS